MADQTVHGVIAWFKLTDDELVGNFCCKCGWSGPCGEYRGHAVRMSDPIDTTIPEMMRRVARALHKQFHAGTMGGRDGDPAEAAWNRELEYGGHDDWYDAARTVIEAMAEPTEAMATAGFDVEEQRYATHHPQEDRCAVDCWRAMINAALGR